MGHFSGIFIVKACTASSIKTVNTLSITINLSLYHALKTKERTIVTEFGAQFCFSPIPGRVTTTGTWQNLPLATTERRQQRTAWWPTKLLPI